MMKTEVPVSATVYLVSVNETPIRVFASRARAEQFIQCMLEEYDENDDPLYHSYEFDISALDMENN